LYKIEKEFTTAASSKMNELQKAAGLIDFVIQLLAAFGNPFKWPVAAFENLSGLALRL
jgi:hypothetical protein